MPVIAQISCQGAFLFLRNNGVSSNSHKDCSLLCRAGLTCSLDPFSSNSSPVQAGIKINGMSCSISPDFPDERYMLLFTSVLQSNKSMLSHWKDFRGFWSSNTTCLPGHSKKSLHKNRKKRGNPNISLQCCCLLHVGRWGQGSNAKVSSGPFSKVGHSQREHIPCAKEAVDRASRGWEGLTGSNRSKDKSRVYSKTNCPQFPEKQQEKGRGARPGQSTQQVPKRCPGCCLSQLL